MNAILPAIAPWLGIIIVLNLVEMLTTLMHTASTGGLEPPSSLEANKDIEPGGYGEIITDYEYVNTEHGKNDGGSSDIQSGGDYDPEDWRSHIWD